jgi:DNA-binding transcriptional regulator YdaS (Cro superfamily)
MMATSERLDLFSVSVARKIRTGADRDRLAQELGLTSQSLQQISTTYAGVPNGMLNAIERVLKDRERLRWLIAKLTRA